MAHLDGYKQHFIKRKEDRNLDEDRQAARRRIDAFLLVKRHGFFLKGLFVASKALFELCHFRLEFFHFCHGDGRFISQREEQYFNDQGQADNRKAHIANNAVNPAQQALHRLGDKVEHAPVNGVDKAFNAAISLVAFDDLNHFSAGKERGAHSGGLPCGHIHGGQAHVGLVGVVGRRIFSNRVKVLAGGRNHGCHPVFIGKADPAVFHHVNN